VFPDFKSCDVPAHVIAFDSVQEPNVYVGIDGTYLVGQVPMLISEYELPPLVTFAATIMPSKNAALPGVDASLSALLEGAMMI
jgi:hypothetical protein